MSRRQFLETKLAMLEAVASGGLLDTASITCSGAGTSSPAPQRVMLRVASGEIRMAPSSLMRPAVLPALALEEQTHPDPNGLYWEMEAVRKELKEIEIGPSQSWQEPRSYCVNGSESSLDA